MKLATVILLSLAALVSGCRSESERPESAMSPAAPSAADPSATSSDEASLLEGTWRTDVITEAEIEVSLRDAGLDKWIEPLRGLPAGDPPAESNVFILEIGQGTWDLSWESNGAAAEPIDFDAQYEVDGSTVKVSHEADFNTYRWSIDGDTLTLTWLDTTYGSYEGIPEEVFQRAFYMTGRFERQE